MRNLGQLRHVTFTVHWDFRRSKLLRPGTRETVKKSLPVTVDAADLPYFQHHRLSEITIAEVDAYRAAKVHERDQLAAARERGEEIPRRPLSNSSINRTITLLGQILELAVEYGHIPANPARGKRRKLKADAPRRSYLDSARQLVALLDAEALPHARHVPRRAILATLVFAGLRISELLALRWRAVDLAGGWLNVSDSTTAAGVRKVKIRPVLHDVLAALKPVDADPDAYVFATRTGGKQTASQVRNRILAATVERANERLPDGEVPLPRLTPHDLRRTFASVLYALGEDPGVVMDEMGHRDPDLALAVYRQSMRRDEGEKDRLRALVEGAEMPGLGTGAQSDPDDSTAAEQSTEAASRS